MKIKIAFIVLAVLCCTAAYATVASFEKTSLEPETHYGVCYASSWSAAPAIAARRRV